uniref:Neuronal vesicle trafficking associated 2 n=1 Tax=Molossus molossus TaxID=27622 RepID=A0A7J8IAU2_MOLMO|nr:neuronal vesicle trafficking associated 2 [Molossus molossus]
MFVMYLAEQPSRCIDETSSINLLTVNKSPSSSAWPSRSSPASCSWWFTKPSPTTTAAQRASSTSTSAASRPPWMLTTHPRTPAPGAASTRSSATTAWPSRALPGPSGPGCRRPPSSMSPNRPRPRAIRGPPQPEWGTEGGPPMAKPSSSSKTTLYSWEVGVGGRGGAGGLTGVVRIDISFRLWYCRFVPESGSCTKACFVLTVPM